MSQISRNGTWGNESDCVRFPACVFVSYEKGTGKERERGMRPRQRGRGGARGKKEVARGDTKVSKDVTRERERNDERERNAM